MTSRAVPRPCSVININITITQAVREFLGHRRKVSAPLSSFRLGGKCKSSCRDTAACLDLSRHCWTHLHQASLLTTQHGAQQLGRGNLTSASVIMSTQEGTGRTKIQWCPLWLHYVGYTRKALKRVGHNVQWKVILVFLGSRLVIVKIQVLCCGIERCRGWMVWLY